MKCGYDFISTEPDSQVFRGSWTSETTRKLLEEDVSINKTRNKNTVIKIDRTDKGMPDSPGPN